VAAPEHDPEAYGRSIGEEYDALYDDVLDTEATVAVLADLAEGGPILEMGIGTGRLALPLLARGLAVAGIEASQVMVERLRAKPGGADVPVVVGDFAEARVAGEFALVVLAFNTIFALPTEDAQVACFENAARHLRPGGRFVVDSWVLDPTRFADGAAVSVRYLTGDRLSLDTGVLDAAASRMETVQVVLSEGRVRLFPANHRYVGPRELDLMARVAGFRLDARWAGWDGAPFGPASRAHVSVYRLPAQPPA
jgi:SAM-dependent methyltransferase